MENKFRIEKRERAVGEKTQFIAICWRATPKGYWAKEKQVWGYHFSSEEKREDYINKFFDAKLKSEQEKEARTQAKKEAKKNMINPFKVGDIMYDSWGYDQTNIDFYQIVETGAKSVKIRPIRQRLVEEAGFMCEYVAPAKDQFTGDAETKILQMTTWYNEGKASHSVYITSRHGSISKWDGQKVYQSHYA